MENKKEFLFKKYVTDKGVDKFTKIQEFEQQDSIKLNCETLAQLSRSLSDENEYDDSDIGKIQKGLARMRAPKFSLYLDLIYRKRQEQDIVLVKLRISQYSLGDNEYAQSLLKDGSIFFLFDEGETIKLDAGDYHGGVSEEKYFQTDLNFLIKFISAKKIEYRCMGKRGVFSEGSLSNNDIFLVKGFYAALFDPEFENIYEVAKKEEAEKEAVEKRKKEAEELKKVEQKKKAAEKAALKKAKDNRFEEIRGKIISLDTSGIINVELLKGDKNTLLDKIKKDDTNLLKDSKIAISVFYIGLIAALGVWWFQNIWKGLIVVVVFFFLFIKMNDNHKKKMKSKLKENPELFNLVIELINDFAKNIQTANTSSEQQVLIAESENPTTDTFGLDDKNGECNVHILEISESKIDAVKVLKDVLDIGLKEAKDLIDQTPSVVNNISKSKALEIQSKLIELGANIVIEDL
jgi:ribosomal protein L7/L12